MKTITAVIFDMDGLLLDTEKIYDIAVQEYAKHLTGKELESEQFRSIRAKMFGRKAEDSAQLLHDALGITDKPPSYFIEWRAPLVNKLFPEAEFLPGAEKFVRHLASHQVPMALATSSTREGFEYKTSRHQDTFQLFTGKIILGDEVKKGKPDPEIFLKAAELLKIAPELCLVFEDAGNGVKAAKAAGMSVVAVPHPYLKQAAVAQADQILSSLEQFEPAEWGLPEYSS